MERLEEQKKEDFKRLMILSIILIFVSIMGTIVTWYSHYAALGFHTQILQIVIVVFLLFAIAVIVGAADKRLTSQYETIVKQEEDLQIVHDHLTDTIKALAHTIEQRDPYSAGHQLNVANIAEQIAAEMGLSAEDINGVYMAAIIHDIGQVYVPTDILGRPTTLSPEEFEIIKSHPTVGHEIMKDISLPWPVDEVIFQHHERLDGSGYPQGLAGDEICMAARIVAVADVLEAITAYRPYRQAHSLAYAIEHLTKNSGVLYDKNVVKACLLLVKSKKGIPLINERVNA